MIHTKAILGKGQKNDRDSEDSLVILIEENHNLNGRKVNFPINKILLTCYGKLSVAMKTLFEQS